MPSQASFISTPLPRDVVMEKLVVVGLVAIVILTLLNKVIVFSLLQPNIKSELITNVKNIIFNEYEVII